MSEYEIEVTGIDKKTKKDISKEIIIDTQDYINSYIDEAFHLQDYSRSTIERELSKLKKEFIRDTIEGNFKNENVKLDYDVKVIMEDLDAEVEEDE